jgi:hypothetical protein
MTITPQPVKGFTAIRLLTPLALLCLMAVFCGCGSSSGSFAETVNVTTFATSVKGKYTQPDSITSNSTNIFIGFSNGTPKDGSDPKATSTVVEYTMDGKVVTTWKPKGHNDGLKIDPTTGLLWSMQNEDGKPNLYIVDPATAAIIPYTFSTGDVSVCGGGYDDVAFLGGQVYMSCSNPAHNPNTDSAIVSVTLSGTTVNVSPVMAGDASAVNIVTGKTVTLNLQDPDSLKISPSGGLVLDSQDDAELIFVGNPGTASQTVQMLPLNFFGTPLKVDDTVFPTSPVGTILMADTGGDTIYRIQASDWPTSGFGVSAGPTSVNLVNLSTGSSSVVLMGLTSPHGMLFIPG